MDIMSQGISLDPLIIKQQPQQPDGSSTISGAIGSSYSPYPFNGLSQNGPLTVSGNYDSTTNLQSVRGELLAVQMSIGSSLLEDNLIDKDKIKHELALELAHKLLSGKYIEFTQRYDFATNNKIITARLFVTPDGQTQIIRKHQEK